MFGLLINRLYLEEILDGRKCADMRPFSTSRHGRIALLDNKEMKLYGFADLVNVTPADYREYRAWQTTIKFQIPEDPLGDRKRYYSYHLENILRIPVPVKVNYRPIDHVWVLLSDGVSRYATIQSSLSDFSS